MADVTDTTAGLLSDDVRSKRLRSITSALYWSITVDSSESSSPTFEIKEERRP